jgi:hypothetical protein
VIGADVPGTFMDLMPAGRSALSFAIVGGNRDILIHAARRQVAARGVRQEHLQRNSACALA